MLPNGLIHELGTRGTSPESYHTAPSCSTYIPSDLPSKVTHGLPTEFSTCSDSELSSHPESHSTSESDSPSDRASAPTSPRIAYQHKSIQDPVQKGMLSASVVCCCCMTSERLAS